MSTYLWVDLFAISVPFLFSFTKWFPFHKEWRYFFPACAAMCVFFLIWDIRFTEMGIWGFNEMHLMGISLWGLPLEEYLFFICIPYACLFTYFVLREWVPDLNMRSGPILFVLALSLLVMGLCFIGKWYTSVTFLLLGSMLLFLLYKRVSYLDHFLLMYLIILLPFSIVNGILTGSWIEQEVVWYNDAENLGVRLGTIPIEDTMYGMLMLMMTVAGMEWLKKKKSIFASDENSTPI